LSLISYACDTWFLISLEELKLQVSKIVCALCRDFRFSSTGRLFEGNVSAEELDARTTACKDWKGLQKDECSSRTEGNRYKLLGSKFEAGTSKTSHVSLCLASLLGNGEHDFNLTWKIQFYIYFGRCQLH
jgi:hypothetical protein